MKLAEGMYVRTKYGYLARITEVNDNSIYCDNAITRDWGEEFYLLYSDQFKEIVKASHNIIDLLKRGDYVNGSKVNFIEEGFIYWETGNAIHPEYIETVLTKEQFESMAYKVVEE